MARSLPSWALRWGHLTVHRLADDLKSLGWAAAVLAGLNLVTLLLFREAVFQSETGVWALLPIVGSLLVAASAFRALHGRSSTDWILWPATPAEKYGAALAETLVAVPLGLAAVASILSALFAGLQLVGVGRSSEVWLPWTQGTFQDWATLEVFLLVMLTGATVFRKHAFWKTGLVIVGMAVAGALGAMIVVGLTGAEFGDWAWHRSMGPSRFDWAWSSRHSPGLWAQTAVDVLGNLWFYGVVPVFCLALGWAKVHEKEAQDEVQ